MASIGELSFRLAQLIEQNADLLPVLDYAAGSLLCLIEAQRYGFQERPGACLPNYLDRVVSAVKEMETGKLPETRFWIAGLHFNSALVRIAASYDRAKGALKQSRRRHGHIPDPPVQHKHLKIDKIRKEVESLKHEPEANHPGRGVQFDEALEGFEELLDFVAKCRP